MFGKTLKTTLPLLLKNQSLLNTQFKKMGAQALTSVNVGSQTRPYSSFQPAALLTKLNYSLQTTLSKSQQTRPFSLATASLINTKKPSFERPNILAGGTGDVASRSIRYAMENPKASVYIIQIQGTKPPFNVMPNNVHIIWTDSTSGSPYTNIDLLKQTIKKYNINEYFPGWGNLSEKPDELNDLQEAMGPNGRIIGPNRKFISDVGHKGNARRLAQESGVPIVPGPIELVTKENFETTMSVFKPGATVMFKAPEAGGGYGMRKATVGQNDREMFNQACAEARCDALVAEKFVDDDFKHYEIQSFGVKVSETDDAQTFALPLERNCSVQYKNAKWVQYSSPDELPDVVRNKLVEYSENLGNAAKQEGPATHEFLAVLKEDTAENRAYLKDTYRVKESDFISVNGTLYVVIYNETNPRLQVEHPVTEMAYGDLDIFELSRNIANHHQTLDKKNGEHLVDTLTSLKAKTREELFNSIQVRVYALESKTYTPESGLTIKLGSTTQSTTANNPPLPPNVHFDGTIGAPPFGQDPLFGKINAKGNDVTTLISRVLENMDTGDTTTNKGFLSAILKESYKSWTVQELGRQFQNIAFINESNKTDLTQDIRSAMKALALTHANGLSVLRPGAKNAPAPHIPELHTPLFSRDPLKHHFGSIFETIQNDFPNMPIIEQRKMASKEYCRQVKERYSKTSTHIGYIDTRRRDTAQSLRQNNFPQELFEPTQAYHDRQPYVSIETTMGGNDQSKRGGELKSENTQFGNQRSQTHVEAGLCRGEIQVKLGDKAATPEERRAYIKDKSKNNGPMLVEIFSPWHSVDDWANEATLWAEAGQSLVIYAPEHAEEMSAKDLWKNFYKPCLKRAEKDGFSDQIAFLGLKDTSSATSMPRAKNELSQLPILAEQDGYGNLPWAHHTHDIGQGVAVSATLADNGFRIFWTSPDNAAGSGANVPECALYNVLKGNGFSPDFDPELAQEMSSVDAYATLLGEPYKANHGQTSTTIIDSYMAPGAIAHTWKALATEFPRATEKEMIDIKKDFIKAHKTLFKLILLVAPLTPNPNKISNMSKDLVKLTKEKNIRISEISLEEFVSICKENLSQLPELIKYLGGSHYPKWAQYSKVEEKYPDLVEKSKELYAELKLSNEDDLWVNKLKKTEETLLELNHYYTESTLTDMAYHGTNLASTLAQHKLTPDSMYMIRESDLQRLSQPGSVQNRTATLLTPNGTIPVTFLGRTTNGSTIEYLVQTYGDSGPILKIAIPGKKEAIAGVSSQTFGLQSNGHFINEGKKGEIVEWYLPKGLVFPGENLGLINEDKNISPITARELSEFDPLVPSTKDSGKTTILESGTKTLELSSISSLTKETKQALLAIHDLRNCEETSALALKALSIDALKEATSHYPVRHASSKSKEATLSFIDHNINDHEAYNSIRDMFKAQLKPE